MDDLRRASSTIIDAVLRAAVTVRDEAFPFAGGLALVSAGKASAPMAAAALAAAGRRVLRGVVVMPHGYAGVLAPHPAIEVMPASHPVPDESGVKAAGRVLEVVSALDESDLCLILLSGGSSSLLSLPRAPLTLEDLKATTALLLRSGADIKQINTVRKHLSRIAGGRLAGAARCRTVTLVISDVVGDDLAFIGSGPTVADPTTFDDALAVLDAYDLSTKVPPTVMELLRDGSAGRQAETPKQLSERHVTRVIASNKMAVEAAERAAAACGFAPYVLDWALTGDAREVGRSLARAAQRCKRSGAPVAPPACIIAGGETTVTVRGTGRGGRNQELALAAAVELDGSDGILVCSFATDGIDGHSEAAGARVDGETVRAARPQGLDPEHALAENDSNGFLAATGALIVTGPTHTNVNDVCFALVSD